MASAEGGDRASAVIMRLLMGMAIAGGAGSLGDRDICVGAFEADKEMPCGHWFYGECLERWLGVHGSCPVCRRELPAKEEQNGGERRVPRGTVVVSYMQVVGEEAP